MVAIEQKLTTPLVIYTNVIGYNVEDGQAASRRTTAVRAKGVKTGSELAAVESMESTLFNRISLHRASEEEITAIIDQIIAQQSSKSPQDMGKIMQALRAEPAGSIDMSVASKIAKIRLQT